MLIFLALPRFRAKNQSTKKEYTVELTRIDKAKESEKLSLNKNRIVETISAEKIKIPDPKAFLGFQTQQTDRQTVNKNKISRVGVEPKKAEMHSKVSSEKKVTNSLGLPLSLPPQSLDSKKDSPLWATAGVRPEDYVEGMAESDRTVLNTREYLFFGYFQRIRDRLDKAWVPILRERLMSYYRSGRQLASSTNHTTKIIVTLNAQGEIVKVQLIEESGTKDLDEAAVSAFNKAGPFPNPPKGMIDQNHEIKIPWDFILKT